jgi:hypothetical protein
VDGPAFGGELHRVLQHVPEDLLKAIRIRHHDERLRRIVECQRHTLLLRGLRDRFDRRREDRTEALRLQIQHNFASDGACQLEEILDEPDLKKCIALDDIGGTGRLRRTRAHFQYPGPTKNRRQRRPQLV